MCSIHQFYHIWDIVHKKYSVVVRRKGEEHLFNLGIVTA